MGTEENREQRKGTNKNIRGGESQSMKVSKVIRHKTKKEKIKVKMPGLEIKVKRQIREIKEEVKEQKVKSKLKRGKREAED